MLTSLASAAKAQPATEPEAPRAETDAATDVETDPPRAETDPNDPLEVKGERYHFLGLRFRDYIAPKFILNLFVDGGATVNQIAIGPEYSTRQDGLEVNAALTFHDASFSPLLFKSKSKEVHKFEEVSSSLKMIKATVDILWELYTTDDSQFAFLLGGGAGIGFVFGKLRENQIYPRDPNNPDFDDLDQWERCAGPGDPDVRAVENGKRYCDDSNNHYGDFANPSWANGGSKPNVYPYLALPQLSFRYKPVKQFQLRGDLGFAIFNGFFLGLNAAYGF